MVCAEALVQSGVGWPMEPAVCRFLSGLCCPLTPPACPLWHLPYSSCSLTQLRMAPR